LKRKINIKKSISTCPPPPPPLALFCGDEFCGDVGEVF
jgi:hypothetical protein